MHVWLIIFVNVYCKSNLVVSVCGVLCMCVCVCVCVKKINYLCITKLWE